MTTLAYDHGLASPGLSDLRPATPKRWPVNPEVIDSPACAMAEFADYKRAYYLVEGSHVAVSARTLDDLLDKAVAWARPSSRIVRVPVIPYYSEDPKDASLRSVGTAPIPGGGWGGECGAMLWVRDPQGTYAAPRRMLRGLGADVTYIQDHPGSGYDVSKLQAWWVNGIADRKPDLDGFKVQCAQKRRNHGPLCNALDFEWNWRDYAPFTDQGCGTQITLF